MGWFVFVGLPILVTLLVAPWLALSRANRALREMGELRRDLALLTRRFSELHESIAGGQPLATMAARASAAVAPAADVTPVAVTPEAASSHVTVAPPVSSPVTSEPKTQVPTNEPEASHAAAAVAPPEVSASGRATPATPVDSAATAPSNASVSAAPAVTAPTPAPPSKVDTVIRQWLAAAREWLFGGNLVAKVGLVILFIGVAFLVRRASGLLSVEVKLAAVAAGAIALLGWGFRIRESRRGIALPAQGAALAILMLVTFGGFKVFGVLPGSVAFTLLFVLVAFTCALAVLQNALWLAVFGISGGFAAPILTSTGDGSHIALFSYYALLNAGILAIALRRSWRALNVLGFVFTFVVGAAWGEQRYVPEQFASAEFFLVLFFAFYLAIAVIYAWRRAPELKSYVDGTLVFGVPMAGMALQYGLVKDQPFGMALSALVVALVYAALASALWRTRRDTLRLLVEAFLALAIAFGTLAIPLALDGRWTSAAWAVEGAAIVWVGLKQKQALAWRFGVAVQVGSWIAFIASLLGVDPLRAFRGQVSLSFLLLGFTGMMLALTFRQHARSTVSEDPEAAARTRFGWWATGFVTVAVVWLLAGLWVEVWLRTSGVARATLLVASALVLVYGLQWLARRSVWRWVQRLSIGVLALASFMFAVLMVARMRWYDVAQYSESSLGELLRNTPFLGGLMLCAGAVFSALAFERRVGEEPREGRFAAAFSSRFWWFAAIFWWCSCVLYSVAHAVAFLTGPEAGVTPWYAAPFWSVYAVGLALSAWAWTASARRLELSFAAELPQRFWLWCTLAGAVIFGLDVAGSLWWPHVERALPDVVMAEAWLALLGGPLCGALLLVLGFWAGAAHADTGRERRPWLIGLAAVWFFIGVDALALWLATMLKGAPPAAWRLDFSDAGLLFTSVSGMLFVRLALPARGWRLLQLRWLALPAMVLQAWVSLVALLAMYLAGERMPLHVGVAFTGCWLAVAWVVRVWRRSEWPLSRLGLQSLHFGRVIAPWLMIAPVVSLGTWHWLTGSTFEESQALSAAGWVVAGKWPDYLAAWVAISGLALLLRQGRRAAWPLEPLHDWYVSRVIPLATLWGVALAIYWNVRQDGSMEPLPYLPLLNPLDITTGFVALLVARVWQANRAELTRQHERVLIWVTAGLAFGWFNLMLLRTAAKYLDMPYRFAPLYHSQFVQAMLAIVWTLSAFFLMRLAVRRLSKPLWMVGAGLLAVVVVKLFAIDLSGAGGVARIVSFMGVGGLMLIIGYLAPLPRAASREAEVRV